MSDRFWSNLSKYAGYLVLLAIFILLSFMGNLEVKDLDLWLHLGMGRTIVESGFQIPDHDTLSCTIAGKPWINHEWLFQVVVHYIHNAFGFDGLINMQIILVISTMLILLFLGYNQKKQLATIFSLLLVSLIYQGRLTIRPDLFSLFFFAVYIMILALFLHRRWSLYALVIVQILWSNIHGFFFFGPLFALIGLSAEWLRRHVPLPYEWNKTGNLDDDEYRRLKWIFVAVVLACLINPYGVKGALYPIGILFKISGSDKIFFDKIIELQKPIEAANVLNLDVFPYYKLLIVISFLSFYFNRRKIDIGVLLFWCVFLGFSLVAIRNMIYFAFAGYLSFVTNAYSLSMRDLLPVRITDKKFGFVASILIKALLVVWLIQYFQSISLNGYFDFDTFQRKSEFGGVSKRVYPSKAVDFLVDNDVKGNFFNDFNSGAYLIGRTYPNIKVFIDGRTEVYGPEFFKYYQKLWENDENPEVFEEMLDKYQITGILMNSVHKPIPGKTLKRILDKKEWVPVYFGYDGVILLKDIPEYQDIIAKHRIDFYRWKAQEFDLYRLGAVNITPYQHIHRAYTLESIDADDAAVTEIEQALKIAPNYYEPYKVLGKIYTKKKDFRLAYENFRIAVVANPADRILRQNLSLSLFDLKEYEHSIRENKKIIERWPGHPRAYFFVAKAEIELKKYDQAFEYLEYAMKVDPDNVDDVIKLGDRVTEQGEYDAALKFYGFVTTKSDKVHFQKAKVYDKLDDIQTALSELDEGLKINPDNDDIKSYKEELLGRKK